MMRTQGPSSAPPRLNVTTRFAAAIIGGAAMLLTGCSSLEIRTQYDRDYDFSVLRTYRWCDERPTTMSDGRIDRRALQAELVASVDEQLAAKGYQKAAGTTDFQVTYRAMIQRQIEVNSLDSQTAYGAGLGPADDEGAIYGGGSGTVIEEWDEKTLIVTVLGEDGETPLWSGVAKTEIFADLDAKIRRKRIQQAVKAILDRFPPN